MMVLAGAADPVARAVFDSYGGRFTELLAESLQDTDERDATAIALPSAAVLGALLRKSSRRELPIRRVYEQIDEMTWTLWSLAYLTPRARMALASTKAPNALIGLRSQSTTPETHPSEIIIGHFFTKRPISWAGRGNLSFGLAVPAVKLRTEFLRNVLDTMIVANAFQPYSSSRAICRNHENPA
jgi:hypothetical protein